MKSLISILISILVLSCSPGGLFKGGGTSVVVESVHTEESSPVINIPGVLIPRDRVEIKFPNRVKVASILVNKGDTVVKGGQLIKLADDEISLRLASLKTQKREAEALLDKSSYILKNRDRLLEEERIDKTQYDDAEIDIAVHEATLNRIKADIAVNEYNSANALITSPIGGIVTEKYVSLGETVETNRALLVVTVIDPILVSFPLTADESGGIAVGTKVGVFVEDIGESREAMVSYISPEINETSRTFDIWAAMPNPGGALKIGMRAIVTFNSAKTKRVVVVPISAVFAEGRERYTFVVDKGIARRRLITVRNIVGGSAEVSQGLTDEELVVVKGGDTLSDGMPVEIYRR